MAELAEKITMTNDSTSQKYSKARVLLVSDCGEDLVCGVTRKQNELQKSLTQLEYDVKLITSSDFAGIRVPYYNELRVALPTPIAYVQLANAIEQFNPDYINFLTEGPLGVMGSLHCLAVGRKYTTMRCSRFDLYVSNLLGSFMGQRVNQLQNWFHNCGHFCITPSPSMADLCRADTPNVIGIPNGCDTSRFSPVGSLHPRMEHLQRPIWLYCGRVSQEKNIGAFLDLADSLEGSIVIVGGGPELDRYKQRYSTQSQSKRTRNQQKKGAHVEFLGWLHGEELEQSYRSADVFVFPSLTDTFGQVQVEALASGLPVAAFPVCGPRDVVVDNVTGSLRENLLEACQVALATKNSEACIQHAKTFTWNEMASKFLSVQPEWTYKSSQMAEEFKVRSFMYLSIVALLNVMTFIVMFNVY